MKRFLLTLLLVLFANAAMAESGLVKKLSARSVQETMDNFEQLAKKKGLTVFARIDHAAGAAKVGKKLPPTQLLIFGNPKVGSALMSSQSSIGIDLPIKVLVWEDGEGKVWLAYNAPAYLAERHGVTDRGEVVEKMAGLLRGLTASATTP